MTRWILPASLAAVGLLALLAVVGARWQSTSAIAPCVPHANTSEELEMKSLVQSWRMSHVTGSVAMTLDSDLNEAAYGYAKLVADNPGASGHNADGSDQLQRAWSCGFRSTEIGQISGGEGIALGTGPNASMSPAQALEVMEAHPTSGIYIDNFPPIPSKCIGVAKASNAAGTKVVWIVLIFRKSPELNCNTAPPPPPSTNTPTNTAVATDTPDATATPTEVPPTATPHYQSFAPGSIREGEE